MAYFEVEEISTVRTQTNLIPEMDLQQETQEDFTEWLESVFRDIKEGIASF